MLQSENQEADLRGGWCGQGGAGGGALAAGRKGGGRQPLSSAGSARSRQLVTPYGFGNVPPKYGHVLPMGQLESVYENAI